MRSNRPAGSSGRMVSVAEPMPAPTSSTRRPPTGPARCPRACEPPRRSCDSLPARPAPADTNRQPSALHCRTAATAGPPCRAAPRAGHRRNAETARSRSPRSGKRAVTSARNASESRGISSGSGSSAPTVTTKPSSFACNTPRTSQDLQHPAEQIRVLGQNFQALAQLLRVLRLRLRSRSHPSVSSAESA